MNLSSTVKIYGGGPGSGCTGPNCGRPKSKLQEMLEHTRDSHVWGNNHYWFRILEYGHPGNTEQFTKEEKKELVQLRRSGGQCKLGFCFMNAQRIAIENLDNPKVQYVEGLVIVHGVPLDHAWIEYNGKVFDPTLVNKSGKQKQDLPDPDYFGVVVPKDEIMKHQLKSHRYEPLSQAYRDTKLQEKIWKK